MNSNLRAAEAAMEVFCQDLRRAGTLVPGYSRDPGGDDSDGRFGFTILLGGNTIRQIQMPGLTLQQVRYLGPPQHVGDYARLYVNGASWLWLFAVDACADHAIDEPDDGQPFTLTAGEIRASHARTQNLSRLLQHPPHAGQR